VVTTDIGLATADNAVKTRARVKITFFISIRFLIDDS